MTLLIRGFETAIDDLIQKKTENVVFENRRGPDARKLNELRKLMPKIHEALALTSQGEVIKTLSEGGLPVSRPTFIKIYKAFLKTNSLRSNVIKRGVRPKKNGGASVADQPGQKGITSSGSGKSTSDAAELVKSLSQSIQQQ